MCGRFSLSLAADIINGKLGVEVPDDYKPSFNIAPTQRAAVILNTDSAKIEMVQWGLVTAWSKSLINARAETLAEKATFKKLLTSKRCVVVADGFYEWKRVGEAKQPYRIVPTKDLFLFAGLWTEAKQEDGTMLTTFTIITTAPNKKMHSIHDRMPVILTKTEADRWLSVADTTLLDAAPDASIDTFRISTQVNNPRNNSPELIVPVG